MPGPTYTLKRVQAMLGVSRAVVVGLIEAEFVTPTRGLHNELQFSFQDLMLLRTAHALRVAGITPAKIVVSLARLRAALPDELPITGLRITAIGSTVAVRDRTGSREADSGQWLIDFDVEPVGADVAILDKTRPEPSPRDWLERAEALEESDSSAAEDAYRKALLLDPRYVDAYLNLGALLCDSERANEAVELYATAVERCPPSAALHFNQAIALEDQGRNAEAIDAYERCLTLEPAMFDAHFNAARLLEQAGEMKAALKHLNSYRLRR